MSREWREVGPQVFVRRYQSFDLNIGLVLGDESCLLIDTRASEAEGRALKQEVRQVTRTPWTVVNTHAHFDHFLGNRVFRPAPIWGQARCPYMEAMYGPIQQAIAPRLVSDSNAAAEIAASPIDPPDHTFSESETLDLGGRAVRFHYLGLGHTDHDAVVEVPDCGVVFAGDLVEEGAPPDFEDSFPLEWPHTLSRLLELVAGPVVPGHGDVVDRGFVAQQAADIAGAGDAARQALEAGMSADQAWRKVGLPEPAAKLFVSRTERQLRSEPPYDPPGLLRIQLGLD